MILLENLFDFLEFCAENNTYIEHQPGTTGLTNRFSRYKLESDTGQQSNFGYPRMEVLQLPFGNVTAFDSSDRDDMEVRLRVIYSLSDKYDYSAQTTAMDNAKQALMEMVNYILTAQQDNTENALLCAFDPNGIRYRFIDRATYGGDAVGCELSLQFRQYIDWENLVYGDLPGYTTFEDRVEDALNTPSANGQYVLTVTGNVISWEEFSASGLVDGNGTTINENKVDLGGELIQDTVIDGGENGFKITQIPDGAHESEFEMSQDLFGLGVLTGTGFRYKLSESEWFFVKTSDDTLAGKSHLAAIGYVNLDTNEECYVDITATDISMMTSNDGINPTGINVNRANQTIQHVVDGASVSLTDGDTNKRYKDNVVVNEFDSDGFMYIGSESVNGSWRFATDSGNLVIQKRVSGSWVTKQTLV